MQKSVCRSFALLKDDNADGFRFVEMREGRPLPYGGETVQIVGTGLPDCPQFMIKETTGRRGADPYGVVTLHIGRGDSRIGLR